MPSSKRLTKSRLAAKPQLPVTSHAAPPSGAVSKDIKAAVKATLLQGREVVEVPRILPRGLSSLPQEVVLLSQRTRLVEATAHVIAEKGYSAASVADIIAYAGVSRSTFYQCFKDKEDCFLSCFQKLTDSHLKSVVESFEGVPDLAAQLMTAIEAYLERVAADHWFARAFISEAAAGPPSVRAVYQQSKDNIATSVRIWFDEVRSQYPKVADVPGNVFLLLMEGFSGFVLNRARSAEAMSVREDARAMSYFCFSVLGLTAWAKNVSSQPSGTWTPPRGGPI